MGKTLSQHAHSNVLVRFVVVVCALAMLASVVLLANPAQAFAASTTAELKAIKTLEGGALTDGQFTFKIEAKTDGAPMPEKTEATNDANGNISFGSATYTAAGTYEYNVTEVAGDDSSITYDSATKVIKVTVTAEAADTSSSTTPDNGDSYTPQTHTTSSSGSPAKVTYNHGGDIDAGYYSPKYVTYDDGSGTENVFCGTNYKSASSSDFGERTAWKATDILNQGIVNYAGLSGLDGDSFGGVMNMLDCVAYLYSYDYRSYDYDNAGGAWANSSDPAVMKGAALRDAVQKVMYNLYPYNAAGYENTADLRKTTQEALFFILKCGQGYIDGTIATADSEFRGYATDQDMFDAAVAFALKGENPSGKFQNYPEGTETYVYWNVVIQESTGLMAITKETAVAQPLIGIYAPYAAQPKLSAEATAVEFKNTKTGGSSDDSTDPSIATSAAGTSGKTIKAKANQTITDTVTYKNLTVGTKYKVTGKLMNKTTGEEVAATCTPAEFTAEKADGTETVTFVVDASGFDVGTELVVFETLYSVADDGTETEVAKHEELTDPAQTVTVNNTSEDTTGKLATTIKVAGTEADGKKWLVLPQQENTVPVVDTIAYTDLVKGATYKVTGTLMLFDKDNVEGKAVATKTEEAMVAADTSGEWIINFGTQTLKPNSFYVVYESATLVKDADGNTVTDGETIEHKNPGDAAQAVIVEKAPDIEITTTDPDNPVFNPADVTDEKKTTLAQPKIGTTVSAGGKTATATTAVSLTETEAANATSVTDTIAYEGFGQDDTYTVTGTLYKVAMASPSTTGSSSSSASSSSSSSAVSSTPTVVKTAELKIDSEKVNETGKGTWTMTFDSIKLEPGYKYYVNETVKDSQGNVVASHGDANTPSQCIMVTKATTANNVTGATQTAKTADTATGIALLAVMVAVGSAALLFGSRRKNRA